MMEVTWDPVLEDALTTIDTDMLYFPATKGTIASIVYKKKFAEPIEPP